MKKQYNPELTDEENPEWTVEMFNKAKTAAELFPHLIKTSKSHTQDKITTTIDYDADIISVFRSLGNNWKTKMNDALRQWLREHAL